MNKKYFWYIGIGVLLLIFWNSIKAALTPAAAPRQPSNFLSQGTGFLTAFNLGLSNITGLFGHSNVTKDTGTSGYTVYSNNGDVVGTDNGDGTWTSTANVVSSNYAGVFISSD